MRAHEFLIEQQTGKIGQRRSQATVGLNKFRDKDLADRVYELNRVMMAAACTDGTFVPKIDHESWAGRYNVAMPYTDVEQDMIEKAFQAIGSEYEDLNHGDLRSQEHSAVNTTSPVTAFKGYPR